MKKKKPDSKIKTWAKGMCGIFKVDGSVTEALLHERGRDKKYEATKYGRSRRG